MSENVYEFARRESTEVEARQWLIRLDGDVPLSDDETATLREWLARSPANRRELARISRFWNQANVLTELAIPLNRVASRRRTWLAPARLAAVFTLVLVAGVVSWLMQAPDKDVNGIYGTVVGEQRTLDLADGSVVQLNTDSQVQVDYGEALRKIRLLRGEAHFDVAGDEGRPFEVFAGGGMVRAVGTAFAVYLKNDDVKVSVTEGQVDLATVATTAAPDPKGAPTAESATQKLGTLRAGQTATFAKIINEINVVPLAELERRQAWRQGFLVFNGEPLSEVIAEVNRYTPMRIEIADPALNTLKVGGRFRVGEFESMFDVLEKSFGVEVAHLGDQRIQLRARGDQ